MGYGRIVLKLSGEALAGSGGYGICEDTIDALCREIKALHEMDTEVALVVGGGNIHRGVAKSTERVEKTNSDYMGMLATVINALALQNGLERRHRLETRVLTAISMREVAEPYIKRRAMRHLQKKRVVIFAGGTGNPYFTTDTAAALRANEIGAQAILKATKVDGVYDKDPLADKGAVKFDRLRYIDVLNKNLRVMDATAVSLCMDNGIEIVVFNAFGEGAIRRAVGGELVGTLIGK